MAFPGQSDANQHGWQFDGRCGQRVPKSCAAQPFCVQAVGTSSLVRRFVPERLCGTQRSPVFATLPYSTNADARPRRCYRWRCFRSGDFQRPSTSGAIHCCYYLPSGLDRTDCANRWFLYDSQRDNQLFYFDAAPTMMKNRSVLFLRKEITKMQFIKG